VEKRINLLVSEIDIITQRLELDMNHQPLKLLGMKASYQLMN
jgi:hypothetical protein